MEKIAGLTIDEMSEKTGLEKALVKQYIEGSLKEDIEQEKLDLGNGIYDPFTLELLMIQLEVDLGAERLTRTLESVRSKRAR